MTFMRRALALAATGLFPTATAFAQEGANAAEAAPNADLAAGTEAVADAAPATMAPVEGLGMPVNGGLGIQEQVTELGARAANFHNGPLLWMCVIISLFVLILLAYTMIRFRKSANPVPDKTSHNTLIEVIWTVVPVLILVGIAIPSITLIRDQYATPDADLTVKVIGNQWYWTYEYPENGGVEIVSNMLKEADDVAPGERARTDADGPEQLAVDNRLVIPAGKVVKFLVTSNDVIHSFAVPAFWTKMDSNPGKINETWVKVDKPGVYFGQCSELCGARHGYMPIAVEVLPEAEFNAWIASKGGTALGVKPADEDAPAAEEADALLEAPLDGDASADEAVDEAATA